LDDDKYFSKNNQPTDKLASWLQHQSPFPHMRSNGLATRLYLPAIKRVLSRDLQRFHAFEADSIRIEDHHHCHAAAGHYTSGWKKTLIFVADGVGDGLSTSVWIGDGERLTKLADVPYPHSLGLFFATITGYLGFRPFRHEGKLVGMAARGTAEKVPVAFPLSGRLLNHQLLVELGLPLKKWLKRLDDCRPEDVAAWLQTGLTNTIKPTVRWWIEQTGVRNIVLTGGIFANVELNRELLETGGNNYYVFPHMGDGGLAAGAAMIMHHQCGPWKANAFDTLALGPEIHPEEIEGETGLRGLSVVDIKGSAEAYLAKQLAQGQIVARACGRMEYGPRALGNRSIFAPTTDKAIHSELNQRLRRSEIMPFAPILLEDDLNEWVSGAENARAATPWMTINVKARAKLIDVCPAVVHVDGTLRPQVVNAQQYPKLYEMLKRYRSLTGIPALINTSFNIHEQPIVCSATEAVIAAKQANIDCIQIGRRIYQNG
jgi:carbamoyltransferase